MSFFNAGWFGLPVPRATLEHSNVPEGIKTGLAFTASERDKKTKQRQSVRMKTAAPDVCRVAFRQTGNTQCLLAAQRISKCVHKCHRLDVLTAFKVAVQSRGASRRSRTGVVERRSPLRP